MTVPNPEWLSLDAGPPDNRPVLLRVIWEIGEEAVIGGRDLKGDWWCYDHQCGGYVECKPVGWFPLPPIGQDAEG